MDSEKHDANLDVAVVTPKNGDGGESVALLRSTSPPPATASTKPALVLPDPPSMCSFDSSEDFSKLCTLLGLSENPSSKQSFAQFLDKIGCSSLADFTHVDGNAFTLGTSGAELPYVLQRKVLAIADFIKGGGDVHGVASMKEIIISSAEYLAAKKKETKRDSLSEIITLNVGGYKFTTTKATLSRVPNSPLEAMVSGRHDSPGLIGKDGSYFIDRNGALFSHILDYLRVGGNVVSALPVAASDRKALSVEADFYGMDGLVHAILCPKVDLDDFMSDETIKFRQEEDSARKLFMTRQPSNPHKGLVPLFGHSAGGPSLPLVYQPDGCPEAKVVLMDKLRSPANAGVPATVFNLERFQTNFNRKHPNILNRIQHILLHEPIIIAGGSVLEALTGTEGIRTSEWWSGDSDVDLFIYTQSASEATRIAKRVFVSLAAINEKWVIMRSPGVMTIHSWNNRFGRIGEKIQIILRLYDSPTEVLFGFDCDCCCCAFDGREVWATSRCLYALKNGINVLNPLHAWPNKSSYELRLAKYAARGFPVAAPGLDKSRIDDDRIRQSKIGSLKGLARLLKVTFELEAHYSQESYVGFPSVRSLRHAATESMDPCERIVNGAGWYDEFEEDVIVPPVLCEDPCFVNWFDYQGNFPLMTNEIREQAWNQIENAVGIEDLPASVPKRLSEAWDTKKHSREYLNADMDKLDLDAIYYEHAYIPVDNKRGQSPFEEDEKNY